MGDAAHAWRPSAKWRGLARGKSSVRGVGAGRGKDRHGTGMPTRVVGRMTHRDTSRNIPASAGGGVVAPPLRTPSRATCHSTPTPRINSARKAKETLWPLRIDEGMPLFHKGTRQRRCAVAWLRYHSPRYCATSCASLANVLRPSATQTFPGFEALCEGQVGSRRRHSHFEHPQCSIIPSFAEFGAPEQLAMTSERRYEGYGLHLAGSNFIRPAGAGVFQRADALYPRVGMPCTWRGYFCPTSALPGRRQYSTLVLTQ